MKFKKNLIEKMNLKSIFVEICFHCMNNATKVMYVCVVIDSFMELKIYFGSRKVLYFYKRLDLPYLTLVLSYRIAIRFKIQNYMNCYFHPGLGLKEMGSICAVHSAIDLCNQIV